MVNLTENAKEVLKNRYLKKNEKGEVVEDIDGLFTRVAKAVASAEETPAKRKKYEKEFKEMMENLEFLPNSPTLMNAGTDLGQLSACFVLPIEDSMESIFDTVKDAALIHKSGGGTGFSFGKLRPEGAVVGSTGGVASGPISFMKVFNSATEQVKQGGCFVGDTYIATARGPVKIKDLKEGDLLYSYDQDKGLVLRPCSEPWLTKRDTEVWELKTDKGLSVIGTPDHPIMRRSGKRLSKSEYIKLSELTPGTPLMPLTRYTKAMHKKREWQISLHDGTDSRMPEHVWLAREAGIKGEVIHHKDGNHLNNSLDNLQGMSASEHNRLHGKKMYESEDSPLKHLTKEQKQHAIDALQEYHKNMTPEQYDEYIQKIKEGVKGVNEERIKNGTHNFINDPPMRHPEKALLAKKNRIATAIWKLEEEGFRDVNENNFESYEKEAGFYNTQRFTAKHVMEIFGSFENALGYANDRNNKVESVALYGKADVWNVEVEDTHNYIVCNKDMTSGIVVSNTRRGANMGILPVSHPDIMKFISCKEDDKEINNFNISVGITDDFMEAVEKKEMWNLIDPHTKEVVGSVPARDVFDKIVKGAWKNGEPGIVFLDKINRDNVVPGEGEIEATNPCGEQPLQGYTACNLGSINLAKMVTKKNGVVAIDKEKLVKTIETAVRFLDDVISVNKYPLKKIDEQTKRSRKIGLGVMGFADVLLMSGVPYDSQEGRDLAEEIMGTINVIGHEASAKLAKEKGEFPVFKESTFDQKKPMRNATVTTLAPTGSISMIANGVSGGIEPVFAYAYTKEVMDGTKLVYMNKILEDKLEEIGINTPEIREKIAEKGTIKDIKEIPEEVRRVFVSSQDISGEDHVLMQAAFQRHTDNAVSKTVNLPNEATEKDVEDIYMLAYETGCKGVTVYRDGSRSTQVMTTGKTKYEGETPEYGHIKPREPGEYMEGTSHKETIGCGSLHIQVTHDEMGLAEVYTGTGSNGGCPAQSEAVARLTSLALRSGIDFNEIVKQLSSPRCMSCMHLKAKDPGAIKVKSCPHAVALALIHEHERLGLSDAEKKAPVKEVKEEPKEVAKDVNVPSNSAEITVCPECGAKVSHEGGCVICPSCGWSKCG